jgi:hypothetical protein
VEQEQAGSHPNASDRFRELAVETVGSDEGKDVRHGSHRGLNLCDQLAACPCPPPELLCSIAHVLAATEHAANEVAKAA